MKAMCPNYTLIQIDECTFKVQRHDEQTYCDVDLEASNPWGLPNWRNPEEYLKYTDIPIFSWRWEFIRRSDAYRSKWLKFEKERANQNGPGAYWSEGINDEVVREYGFNLTEPYFDCHHDGAEMALFDGRGDVGDFQLYPVNAIGLELLDTWVDCAMNKNHVLAKIDPWSPLGPQLEMLENTIKAYLEDEDQRLGILREDLRPEPSEEWRARVDKYPLYLRLLDARDQSNSLNGSWKDIVDVLEQEGHSLSVNRDSVRRVYKQALDTQEIIPDAKVNHDK